MTLTLELKPEVESRLREKAEKAGQSLPEYLIAVADAEVEDEEADEAEGSAYDLFKGLLGQVSSDGTGRWSEDCGKKFAEGMAEKRRQGRL
jgi:hypothetical protein